MKHDVIIVGGGVSGTALLYTLSRYTNLKNIGLIEKYSDFGKVNSAPTMNSQTLHFGDIETNYTIEKARKVKRSADMVMNYLENEKAAKGDENLFIKVPKMVLAVGKDQVNNLRNRYPAFGELFPKLKMIGKEEIGKLEPRILEGRDPDQELLALITEDGYTVDFKKLSYSFVSNAKAINPDISVYLSTKVIRITRAADNYLIKTDKGDFEAPAVVVAAGSHSMLMAKSLGMVKSIPYYRWQAVSIQDPEYLTARFIQCRSRNYLLLQFTAIPRCTMNLSHASAQQQSLYSSSKDITTPHSGNTGKHSD